MEKVLVCEKSAPVETGGKLHLTYYITRTDLPAGTEGVVLESYGVGIREACSGDEACIGDITMDRRRVEQLVDMLATGLVTPTSLADTIADWL